MFVELTDGVVLLRCLEEWDAAEQVAGEDADWIKWFSGGPGSIEGVTLWIRENRDEWTNGGSRLNWAVVEISSGMLVGNVEVNLDLSWLDPGHVNISYGVFADHRGQGFATRAVHLVYEWLAEQRTDAHVAVIQIAPDNVRSFRIPMALQFEECGRIKNEEGEEMIVFRRPLR